MRLLFSLVLFSLVSTANARTPTSDTVPRSAIERGVAEGYRLQYAAFYKDRIENYRRGAEIATRQVCRYNRVDCDNLPADARLYLPPPETLKCLARSTGDNPCERGSFRRTADPATEHLSLAFDPGNEPAITVHDVEGARPWWGAAPPTEESTRVVTSPGHTTNPWMREGAWSEIKSLVIAHYRDRYPETREGLADRDSATMFMASVCLFNLKRGMQSGAAGTCEDLAPGTIMYLPPWQAVYCDVSDDARCEPEDRKLPEWLNYLEVKQDGKMVIRLQSGR